MTEAATQNEIHRIRDSLVQRCAMSRQGGVEVGSATLAIAESMLAMGRGGIFADLELCERLADECPFGLEDLTNWHQGSDDYDEALKVVGMGSLSSLSPQSWCWTWPQSVRILASNSSLRRAVEVVAERFEMRFTPQQLSTQRAFLSCVFGKSCRDLSDADCHKWLQRIHSEKSMRWLRHCFDRGWSDLTDSESIRLHGQDDALSRDFDAIAGLKDATIDGTPLHTKAITALRSIADARNHLRNMDLSSIALRDTRECKDILLGHLQEVVAARHLHRDSKSFSLAIAMLRLESGGDLTAAVSQIAVPNHPKDATARLPFRVPDLSVVPPLWLWADAIAWNDQSGEDFSIWEKLLRVLPQELENLLADRGVMVKFVTWENLDSILNGLSAQLGACREQALTISAHDQWQLELAKLLKDYGLVLQEMSPRYDAPVGEPVHRRELFHRLLLVIRELVDRQAVMSTTRQSVTLFSTFLDHRVSELPLLESDRIGLQKVWRDAQSRQDYAALGIQLRNLPRVLELNRWRHEVLEFTPTPTLGEMAPWYRLANWSEKQNPEMDLLADFVDATNSIQTLISSEKCLSTAEQIRTEIELAIYHKTGDSYEWTRRWKEKLHDGLLQAFVILDETARISEPAIPAPPFDREPMSPDELSKSISWWNHMSTALRRGEPVPPHINGLLERFPRGGRDAE